MSRDLKKKLFLESNPRRLLIQAKQICFTKKFRFHGDNLRNKGLRAIEHSAELDSAQQRRVDKFGKTLHYKHRIINDRMENSIKGREIRNNLR